MDSARFLESEAMTGSGPDTDRLREWTLKLFNPVHDAEFTGGDWGWANPP